MKIQKSNYYHTWHKDFCNQMCKTLVFLINQGNHPADYRTECKKRMPFRILKKKYSR